MMYILNKINQVLKMSTKYNKKPFCKVCHDAGKKESEYSNHYVRSIPDRNGVTKVTCPTLLSMECRYCYKTGHTAKFCPDIKNRNQNQEKREVVAPKNFTEKVVEEFPALCAKVAAKPVMTGWSEALAKNASYANNDKEHFEILGRSKMRQIAPINQVVKKGWADYSDSDEDEEEEDEQETTYNKEQEEDW